MKFVVPSKVLYSHASAVSKVINSKNALQILNNLLFILEGDEMLITGSDVENALTATVKVSDVEGSGRFCLDARRMVELLRELPNEPLTFDINDDNLEVQITYPSGDYSMVAIPGDQYPAYTKDDGGEEVRHFSFPCSQLLKGIENTIFAVGTDDFHPQMMGILWDVHEDGITFVATDTRKMVKYVNNTYAPGITARCIMPTKPASILKAILPAENKDEDKEGDETPTIENIAMAEIDFTSKSATFTVGAFKFNCRFIKGNYPDYSRVIPANNPYELRVDRVRFVNAVRRVGVFVDPGFGMEKFRISSDKIEIKTSDLNMQTYGNETLDCEYNGPDLVIGFNGPYLAQIGSTIPTETMIVRLADPSRPGVFVPTENPENTELLMLLMPMNVQEF